MSFTFTTPRVKPVTPAVDRAATRTPATFALPRAPLMFRQPATAAAPVMNTPGTKLGSSPAPLGSMSIGLALAPRVALAAAVAGARAAFAAGKK